uniref:M1 family metallopeptidase n=1 Tax=Sphingomonas sp. TaxID=28214 RepID=UPI00286D1B51
QAAPQSVADTVDPTLPTQLPRTAIPSHYAIEFTPHADTLTFDAKVGIDLKVIKPTHELVLNAADLKIASASLAAGQGQPLAAKVSTDAEAQTATFDFGREIKPGTYRLDIAYAGTINTQANGLFALDYTNVDGKPARALFTQFEASDARRFVPSWDEPDYRATFDLTARVPSADMAVSNMPSASSRDAGSGLKDVKFATTPSMSSYLLFFATGDLERITRKVGDREVGVVMSRGNGDKAHYALDAEAQILPYYDEYFGRPYPLPKLDNVAGPGQSQFFGAMENWGAIFTFEKILLLDPAISSEANKQSIFSVEAHEMAHMWFGDLVTMAWWDDLWLNEGFANWMENRTTQHFHPDWGADVEHVANREKAMDLDSFQTTHPVVQSIRTVEQANQAFDSITYDKGESVISMLEGFAGENVWRTGLRNYIAKFAYRNTRTSDLWAAMEGAGAKGLTVIAKDFTGQPGIPLIEVGPSQCVNGRTAVTFAQTQFSNDRRAAVQAKPLSWHVPVRVSGGGAPAQVITSGRSTRIEAPGCGVLLINPGQTGYYRTLYAPAQFEALRAAFPGLNPVDQFGLLSDALALSTAGYQPMARALDLLAAVPAQAHGKVYEKALFSWANLHDNLDGDPAAQAAIKARVLRDYGPRLQRLGFVPRAGEPPLDALLRPSLIQVLGDLGDPRVVGEGQRLLAAWQKDPGAIPGSLKESWLRVIARNATPATWETLHRIAAGTRGTVERTTLYQLLGEARNQVLARRALELALTSEPGPTVSAGMIRAASIKYPAMTLDFVLGHLAQVNRLVDTSGRSRYVGQLVQESGDAALVPKLLAYATANLGAGDRRPVEQAVGRIRWEAGNRPRIRGEVNDWLKSH